MITAGGTRNEQGKKNWNRLKPVFVDYLDSIGFPSKGDARLLDLATQEVYFAKLHERYHRILSENAVGNDIDSALASLSLDTKPVHSKTDQYGSKNAGSLSNELSPNANELAVVLMSMRKIREAIVASSRTDDFALKVYKFIINTTIPLKHMESYHPSLLHLLYKLHPIVPLHESEYHEFVDYYILDLACRQDDIAAAIEAKHKFNHSNARIEAVLKALIHGNWCIFWSLKEVMTGRQRSLMGWADEKIRTHTLQCLGRSYLSVDLHYLEKSIERPWSQFEERKGLGWQLNGDIVTIRKIGRK